MNTNKNTGSIIIRLKLKLSNPPHSIPCFLLEYPKTGILNR